MSLASDLGKYANSLNFSDLGSTTIAEAKRRIIDTLGCAIGAYGEKPVKMARSLARRASFDRPATLLGTDEKTSPDLAAFVDGLMMRYFDFNDTYLALEPAHPSDNLGPCISVAESYGSTGRNLILALVLAYEVQCRLCDAADLRHKGWDHVCYGLVSSALAVGKLMKLTDAQLTQAVNISLNAHIAMRQVRVGELSMWKGASFSNAARNAVFAALMAKEGMTGPSPIFEGEMGFFNQVSGPFSLKTSQFGGRGGTFKVKDTYLKYFPAEYHSQSAIWAALAAKNQMDGSEVKRVRIDTHEAGYTILGKDPEKWRPMSRETADHSLPYIVGLALLEGEVDNSTYSDRKLRDERNLQFLRKIEVREDEEFSRLYPRKGIANRITVELKSGKKIVEEVIFPKGHPENAMSDEETEAKFVRLTRRFLKSSKIDGALDLLWKLEKISDISELLRSLEVD